MILKKTCTEILYVLLKVLIEMLFLPGPTEKIDFSVAYCCYQQTWLINTERKSLALCFLYKSTAQWFFFFFRRKGQGMHGASIY